MFFFKSACLGIVEHRSKTLGSNLYNTRAYYCLEIDQSTSAHSNLPQYLSTNTEDYLCAVKFKLKQKKTYATRIKEKRNQYVNSCGCCCHVYNQTII